MIRVNNVTRSYADRVLFAGVTFDVNARDRIALIGLNGSGKTTLLDILAGESAPDSGDVVKQKDITIGYLRQDIRPSSEKRLLQTVLDAASHINRLAHRIAVLQAAVAADSESDNHPALLRELGELQTTHEALGGYEIEHEAKAILSGLGFKQTDFVRSLNEFSGGWLMRAALAKLLFIRPDVLLLDEPTNHLDIESTIWFEKYLRAYQGAVIITSHDREFLNRTVERVLAIEEGAIASFRGNYDAYLVARERQQEILRSAAARQEKVLEKETRFIERFRAKATKARQVQSRIKNLEKIERIALPRATKKIHFAFPPSPRSGKEVITLLGVYKSYDNHAVYRALNLTLEQGDRVALVGPNGAGKSTLLKILAGVLPFEAGERRLGHNVVPAYYAQYVLELLHPANSILEELRQAAPAEAAQGLRRIAGGFLFSGDAVSKPIAVLSGGEKARVALAKMLTQPSNLLLMDEPTNHLDIASREILADALNEYQGTLCLITHDRTLIRQVANKIIDVEGGQLRVFPGDYDSFLAAKENAFTPDAAPPKLVNKPRKAPVSAVEEKQKSLVRESKRLLRRISEIENQLKGLEPDLANVTDLFAHPEHYADKAQVVAANNRYQRLSADVKALTAEWEALSVEAERVQRQLEDLSGKT